MKIQSFGTNRINFDLSIFLVSLSKIMKNVLSFAIIEIKCKDKNKI
jgi:hypothetical protein